MREWDRNKMDKQEKKTESKPDCISEFIWRVEVVLFTRQILTKYRVME